MTLKPMRLLLACAVLIFGASQAVAKSDAAETIKAEMKARSATELSVGNHAVKLTASAGRVSVDWRKAEKAGLDLEPYKKVGASYETLTVK